MERERIAELLEKYWQAETTVEEERLLAEYFHGNEVAPQWEQYTDMFSFFREEGQAVPNPDLGERIMEQLRPRRHLAWWAAAAVIILGLGLTQLFRPEPVMPLAAERSLHGGAFVQGETTIKDTYDDPRQALAAVQKALFTVSRKMNKGLHPLK